MRNTAKLLILTIFLVVIFCALGCGIHGQGETAAEGSRRHQRVIDTSVQQLADDVDSVLMLDRPSRLSETRVR